MNMPRLVSFRALFKKRFTCPLCDYRGSFVDLDLPTGFRKYAQCPNCKALERHRLQFLVFNEVFNDTKTEGMTILHVAPESVFCALFKKRFGHYESADLSMDGVDHKVDLQNLPFCDASYDVVYASHVMEHISDDRKALSEISRILRPNGIAILPVPIVVNTTVEYPDPNPKEEWHVRAPGMDYYERYKTIFQRVDIYDSDAFPAKHQGYIYEDRSYWPTEACPLRTSMQGKKHVDIVPVCYK